MNTGVISMRYAKALFAYAKEQEVEDAIYGNMLQLMHTLQHVKELREVLATPSLSADERVSLLFIAHCYVSLYRSAKNIIAMTFTTAQPVDEALREKVSAAVSHGGAVVEMHDVVDPDIIGGFICETETHRLDASVRRQLRDIEIELVKQNRKLV